MTDSLDILVLGAAYGLLPAVRLSLGGNRVTVVCRENEREALVERGASVTLQRRDGRDGRLLHAPAKPGRAQTGSVLGVVGPDVSTQGYDIVILAMSEPQYADASVDALMARIANKGLPVISLMNLLPACFLRRLNQLDVDAMKPAYGSWDVWQRFDPDRVTAASPDAQAVRMHANRPDLLSVTLASNFKVAPFHDDADQGLLAILEQSTARIQPDDIPGPARFVAHRSLGAPLSKWPMLIAGNCRCMQVDGNVITIAAAVRDRLEESRRIYDAVANVAVAAGALTSDLVPFAAYASAARQLTRPSSLARALAAGAARVERIDLMILHAARSLDMPFEEIAEISENIQSRVERNLI